jgi:hypothetical protein
MQIHTTDGSTHEISAEEGKKLYYELAKQMNDHHVFNFNGRQVALTTMEVKHIANYYWEHIGKHSMVEYYKKYQHKAAEHIMRATHSSELPATEKNVKSAIAYAVAVGEPGLIAEVIFEGMEWAIAYAALESIED